MKDWENLTIPVANRPNTRQIQDYAGQNVPGAGEHFTSPLLIRHNKHYDRVSFEIAPLAKEYDNILPCWWLAKHRCDLLANNSRIKFDTEHCQKNCTMNNHENFSLEWDPVVLTDKDAGILGRVAAVPTEDDLQQQ